MEKQESQSIKIDGLGKFTGGEFHQVNISGTGTFTSDVRCNNYTVSGMGSVQGELTCGHCKVSGTAKVEGDIHAQELEVSGTIKAKRGLWADKVRVKGLLKVEESLKSNTLESSGSISVGKDISSETITVEGMMNAEGFVNCEQLTMRLAGTSTINEIGASTVKVEEGYGNVVNFFNMFVPKKYKYSKLVVEVIEGDLIEIANTQAKMVRGTEIKIGPNCVIDCVEYGETIEIDPTALVKHQVRI